MENQKQYFRLVVTEKNCAEFGKVIASTKTPRGKFRGMNEKQFAAATSYFSCYTTKIEPHQ